MSEIKAFDPHCLELAEYFLKAEPGEHDTDENRRELAWQIQKAAEWFFKQLERK